MWLKDNFSLDYRHHYDLGAIWASLGIVALFTNPMLGMIIITIGLFVMLDDVMGHYSKSKGGPEIWVLERIPFVKWLMKVMFVIIIFTMGV